VGLVGLFASPLIPTKTEELIASYKIELQSDAALSAVSLN